MICEYRYIDDRIKVFNKQLNRIPIENSWSVCKNAIK